jgi:hypothetical protein
MPKYYKFLSYLRKQHKYPIIVKANYLVIGMPGTDYHITIFRNQWDDYQQITGKPYHLFHISSDNERDRCSSYFWVDKHSYLIKKIPKKYFLYSQQSYSYYSSTRNPCNWNKISILLKRFQKVLLDFRHTLLR